MQMGKKQGLVIPKQMTTKSYVQSQGRGLYINGIKHAKNKTNPIIKTTAPIICAPTADISSSDGFPKKKTREKAATAK